MKRLKNIFGIAFALPVMLMTGCAGDNVLLDSPDEFAGEVPDELTLTLYIPPEEVVELGATRAPDPALTSITFMCFDKSGKGLSTKTYTSGWTSASSGYEIRVPIHKKTYSVQIVTNISNIGDNAAGASDPSTLVRSNVDAGSMWGKADIKDILSSGSRINLLRQNARVSVSSSAAGFTLKGFGIYGTAKNGTLAPAAANVDLTGADAPKVTAPTIPAEVVYNVNSNAANLTEPVNVFETAATAVFNGTSNCARVIVRGEYAGREYYYPVAFRLRSGSGDSEVPGNYSYTPIPLLRNHHYKIQVLEVRGEGWQNYADACRAQPDNRLTVLITDQDDSITDITANRDFMLGIGGDITVAYNANATVMVLTSYTDKTPAFSADRAWVKTSQVNLGTPATVTGLTAGTNSTGKKYTVTLPLEANDKSTDPRSANVTVRVGDLVRTFVLTQQGRDYKRDSSRPVVLEGLPGGTISNYFNWVDNTCQGLKPEQNRGVVRNEGLHFPAVPAYTLVYKIKALSGDVVAVKSGPFSVTTTGGYHEVRSSDTSNVTIKTGELQITASDGTVISYPIYKTGYFHQLTASTNACQREDHKVNGWFYYEVVKAGSKYILDRNLGASSNAPYITTYAPVRNNTEAIGGFFKIATVKSTSYDNPSTIIGSLGLHSKFKIPTRDDIKGWNVVATDISGVNNELAKVATISVSDSKVKDGVVFLPHAGYYEGTDSKYETHANVWTRTLLSGNQGFSADSPEFGYWYLYLDCYGTKTAFSNLRFCSGSCGSAPNDDSVYKYLPLRLQWN